MKFLQPGDDILWALATPAYYQGSGLWWGIQAADIDSWHPGYMQFLSGTGLWTCDYVSEQQAKEAMASMNRKNSWYGVTVEHFLYDGNALLQKVSEIMNSVLLIVQETIREWAIQCT